MINTVRYMKLTNLASAIGGLALVAVLAACSSSTKGNANDPNTPAAPPNTNALQTEATSGEVHPHSNGSTGDANSACKPDVVVQFCETIKITGAETVSGTGVGIPEFDQDGGLDLKCATWVSNQPENSDYPQLQLPTDAVDGHQLRFSPWKFPSGAGTSDIAKYAGVNTMSIDTKGFQDTAVDVNNTTASSGTMQINADGSGVLTFENLGGETGKISGSLSWTCVDPES
jgi:hypothetical protein